jgi:hypothetical protein
MLLPDERPLKPAKSPVLAPSPLQTKPPSTPRIHSSSAPTSAYQAYRQGERDSSPASKPKPSVHPHLPSGHISSPPRPAVRKESEWSPADEKVATHLAQTKLKTFTPAKPSKPLVTHEDDARETRRLQNQVSAGRIANAPHKPAPKSSGFTAAALGAAIGSSGSANAAEHWGHSTPLKQDNSHDGGGLPAYPSDSQGFYWRRAKDGTSFEGGYNHQFKNGMSVDAFHVKADHIPGLGLNIGGSGGAENIGGSAGVELATVKIPTDGLFIPQPKADELSVSLGTASYSGKLFGNGKSELALEASAISAERKVSLGNSGNELKVGVGFGAGGSGAIYHGEDTDNDGYGEWGGNLSFRLPYGLGVGVRVEPGLVKDKIAEGAKGVINTLGSIVG